MVAWAGPGWAKSGSIVQRLDLSGSRIALRTRDGPVGLAGVAICPSDGECFTAKTIGAAVTIAGVHHVVRDSNVGSELLAQDQPIYYSTEGRGGRERQTIHPASATLAEFGSLAGGRLL